MSKARVQSIVSIKHYRGVMTINCVLFYWHNPRETFQGVYRISRDRAGDYMVPQQGDTVQHYGGTISKVVSRPMDKPKQRKEDTMSKLGVMSEDRVRFFLHYRYYCNEINNVLIDAFNLTITDIHTLRRDNSGGFWIICRPSQFARFMIYRDAAGITNGFKDLNAELREVSKPVTLAQSICHNMNVPERTVIDILFAAGVDPHAKSEVSSGQDEVEVWKNSHLAK